MFYPNKLIDSVFSAEKSMKNSIHSTYSSYMSSSHSSSAYQHQQQKLSSVINRPIWTGGYDNDSLHCNKTPYSSLSSFDNMNSSTDKTWSRNFVPYSDTNFYPSSFYDDNKIWQPVSPQIFCQQQINVNTSEMINKSSSNHQHQYQQESYSYINNMTPVGQSTPRAIRKAASVPIEKQEQKREERKEEKKEEKKEERPIKEVKQESNKNHQQSKFHYKDGKDFYSGNDKSNKNKNGKKQRQLPLRSEGIDLSQFLNKYNESPVLSPISSPGSSKSSHNTSGSNCTARSNGGGKNINRCSFCENNGEKEEVYMSHPLKDSLGKIVCPMLRSFKCPKCGASGDYAHTNKYCPIYVRKQKENKINKYLNQLE